MQAYSDVTREKDPTALPDVEVWESMAVLVECPTCGLFTLPETNVEDTATDCVVNGHGEKLPESVRVNEEEERYYARCCDCPSCGKDTAIVVPPDEGDEQISKWWYWFCFPGCTPESDLRGPFDSRDEAMKDARSDGGF